MDRKINIPVNARSTNSLDDRGSEETPAVTESPPVVTDQEFVAEAVPDRSRVGSDMDAEQWRERALRLQAEIQNYRKRQRRLAQEQILEDRERLLRALLPVADDLERILGADTLDVVTLREGVALTYQNLRQLLRQEGVEPIQPEGEPFDPSLHEAIGSVPYQATDAEPNTVVRVTERGYRLNDRVLRPARVLIAV
jgi:molecular chaperone GrpE